MTTIPPYMIDPPPPPAIQPGIFDVALGPMSWPVPAAAGGGITYLPDDCNHTYALIPMSCTAITGAKTFTGIESAASGTPFVVMTSYQCSPVGVDLAEAERRVRLRMSLREQRAVEQRIWSGATSALGTIPSLFANATILPTASCVAVAVEQLEQWLADNGILGGIIHARPGMSAHLADHFQFESPPVQPRVKRTHLGTAIVFGQGYAGTGPSGQAIGASDEWMYATGRVLVWRDDDVLVPPAPQIFDRSTNTAYLLAERTYNVIVECGVAAILVNRSCTS